MAKISTPTITLPQQLMMPEFAACRKAILAKEVFGWFAIFALLRHVFSWMTWDHLFL